MARNDGKPISWPLKTHGPKGSDLEPYKTAADIIDWSIPTKSIFNRKKPLAENTMKRIAKGLEKFVFNLEDPFTIPEECVAPFITECANASSQRNMAMNEPLRTICAQVKGGHFAMVTSSIIKLRGTNTGHLTNEPLHTISAGGMHLGEVRAFFVQYYGTSVGHQCSKPLHTITTKDRFGLVTIKGEAYQIVDIGLRMLEPHELFAAHGFPSNYQISLNSTGKKRTKASQVARCGNSVPPPMAQALVEANTKPIILSKVA